VGTIIARQRKTGGKAYLARIRLKEHGKLIHQEASTFETHRAARDWIRDREAELSKPGAIIRENATATLADAIDRYTTETRRQIGKTKAQVLDAIRRAEIATRPCQAIRAQHIVDYAQALRQGRSAATVGNYLSHLQAVFAVARPAWGMQLDPQAMKDAFTVCRRLGLTGKSQERSRRPTIEEIDRLISYFRQRAAQALPMDRVIVFAIFSTRRQEEITRIAWTDLDEAHSRVLVRDMKNPGQTKGNDIWCDLPPEAMAVIQSMPRRAPEIFPYSAETISANFTRATRLLGIDDLRFHDLRHEGVTRLFEMGWTIPHVAAVSGHRSWQSLKRYTHIKQAGDRWAGWNQEAPGSNRNDDAVTVATSRTPK
jgi:integrase